MAGHVDQDLRGVAAHDARFEAHARRQAASPSANAPSSLP